MKNFKGDSGNWKVNEEIHENEYGAKFVDIDSPFTEAIASVYLENQCGEINYANANLIAAAPEMLGVLMSLENDNNSIPHGIWRLRNKVMDKALGNEEDIEDNEKLKRLEQWLIDHNVKDVGDYVFDSTGRITMIDKGRYAYEIYILPVKSTHNLGNGYGSFIKIEF